MSFAFGLGTNVQEITNLVFSARLKPTIYLNCIKFNEGKAYKRSDSFGFKFMAWPWKTVEVRKGWTKQSYSDTVGTRLKFAPSSSVTLFSQDPSQNRRPCPSHFKLSRVWMGTCAFAVPQPELEMYWWGDGKEVSIRQGRFLVWASWRNTLSNTVGSTASFKTL